MCGATASQWAGRCARCGEWNTLVEALPTGRTSRRTPARPIAEVGTDATTSVPTGIEELDRVLGGGVVSGSVTLLGGEPGIGKSTLALQVCAEWAAAGHRTLYVSAEESASQVAARAHRLERATDNLWLVAADDIDVALAEVERVGQNLVVIDSVQTLHAADAAPGQVSQVREVTRRLVDAAKTRGVTVIVIGQVTKDGELAGPKTLEHLVDTVLSFEGDRHQALRFLRAVKHRFGPTGDVGLFEMASRGLMPVADPSALFLADRVTGVPGSAVVPVVEGDRPVLVETQALVSPKVMALPRRTAQGLDHGRVTMLAAVAEQRGHVALHEADIHTSTVGGVRVTEPAADLGVLIAMASAQLDQPIPPDMVALGEVGLVGEIRRVTDIDRRLREAERLGFRRALVPASADIGATGIELLRVTHILDALQQLARARRLSSTAA